MSSLALRQQGLVVADQVLTPASFGVLRDAVANANFRGVHTQKWDKVWRLWDGNPLRGDSVYYDPGRAFDWRGATYPTATPVDELIDAVRLLAAQHSAVVGTEGVDWIALYLSSWLYPVGSALSLHQDSNRYTGSFTFFVHARWSVHWGGELFLYPSVGAWPARPGLGAPGGDDEPWMSDDGPADHDSHGIATAVSPIPNRLVLISENRPHRVARVDQNAGAHVRASLSGFFLRPP